MTTDTSALEALREMARALQIDAIHLEQMAECFWVDRWDASDYREQAKVKRRQAAALLSTGKDTMTDVGGDQ